jgi:hypothetical protein
MADMALAEIRHVKRRPLFGPAAPSLAIVEQSHPSLFVLAAANSILRGAINRPRPFSAGKWKSPAKIFSGSDGAAQDNFVAGERFRLH